MHTPYRRVSQTASRRARMCTTRPRRCGAPDDQPRHQPGHDGDRSSPTRPPSSSGATTSSYAQLHGMAAKVAGSLRAAGVEPGDRVAIILPNVPAFPVVFFGSLLAGGHRRADEPAAQGRRDRLLLHATPAPRSRSSGRTSWPRRPRARRTRAPRIVQCGPMGPDEGALEGGEPDHRAGRARRRRHRDRALHLGHDRPAQGRRADPQQHPPQRPPQRRRHPGDQARRRRHGLPAAVPRVRARGRAQRRRRSPAPRSP